MLDPVLRSNGPQNFVLSALSVNVEIQLTESQLVERQIVEFRIAKLTNCRIPSSQLVPDCLPL
jgi:hypothetical protein